MINKLLVVMKTNERQIKTKELFLYIADKLKDVDTYGAVMLNKAFYFIDNYNYIRIGDGITCFSYIKQDRGPTPNPSQFMPLKSNLISEGVLKEVERDYHGYKQKRCVSIRKADMSLFDKNEKKLINDVLNVFIVNNYSASELSDITHNHLSWQIANEKEILPFYSFLITKSDIDKSDKEWALKSISAYENI